MDAFLKSKPGSSSSLKPKKPVIDEKTQKKKKIIAIPWVEKYRPKSVDDVVHQEEVVAVMKKCLKGADVPNLLFYGPPGTGKTSTILALAREIFGDLFKERTLELNASDERGIQVVREKVKAFSQRSASNVRPDGKKCPPFKIVILDEADSMTNAAQAALRRTMEKQTKSTRFCLICNYVSRIIEPLTSRCSKFRFKLLSTDIVVNRLRDISQEEGVTCSDEVLSAIVETSEGDMRKAITILQCAHRLKGEDGILLTDVDDIAGVVPISWIKGLFSVCESDSYEKLNQYITDLIYEGYTAGQVMSQIHDFVIKDSKFDDIQRSTICEKLAICDKRLLDGADEYLQLMDLCCLIMQQICHPQGAQ